MRNQIKIQIFINIEHQSSQRYLKKIDQEITPRKQQILMTSPPDLEDPLLESARNIVIDNQQGSVSIIQRKLRIGYSRAAKLLDRLEELGVVGPFRGSQAREVLISSD